MALRRFNQGGKKQKELSEEQTNKTRKCLDTANSFRDKFTALFVKGSNTAATICANVKDATIQQLKDDLFTACSDVNNVDKSQTAQKGLCDTAFRACRKNERLVASEVDRCKPAETSCSLQGNLTKTQAQTELDTANRVRNALLDTEAKFGSALKDAKLDTGPGDDGQLPAAQNSSRSGRQAESNGCTAVKDGWLKFNQSADAAVQSADQETVDSKKADTVVSNLGAISNRETLSADLASCSNGRQEGVVPEIVRIRVYVFWCIWWRGMIIEVRITIIVVIYQLPNPIASTTALPASSTTASGTTGTIKTTPVKVSATTAAATTAAATTAEATTAAATTAAATTAAATTAAATTAAATTAARTTSAEATSAATTTSAATSTSAATTTTT